MLVKGIPEHIILVTACVSLLILVTICMLLQKITCDAITQNVSEVVHKTFLVFYAVLSGISYVTFS